MKLPEQLEAKFQLLLTRYPIKRSALIPMLLFGQDVFGFVSDELVEEIAARLPTRRSQETSVE
jgi:NADH-quinone oxidoreductase subunit E